jgi:secreted trypsin-like serine protease
MKTVSIVTCLSISAAAVWASTPGRAQSVMNLDAAIKANPQAAAIARGATGRIVGGEVVSIANHPWQVALVRGLVEEPVRSQFCGGSIIAPTWVLTAAHCVRNSIVREDPTRINIVVGTSQFFTGGERVQVAAIHVHTQYNSATQDSDFALLRLTKPITTPVAKPIDLADKNTELAEGAKTVVTGWGATAEGGPGSLDLLGAEVPVVSNATCNKPESYNGDITPNMLCAGKEIGGIDSCQGDSGGPQTASVQGKAVLVGVVSWGEGCARRLKFGVYARVTSALPWIASTTGK